MENIRDCVFALEHLQEILTSVVRCVECPCVRYICKICISYQIKTGLAIIKTNFLVRQKDTFVK